MRRFLSSPSLRWALLLLLTAFAVLVAALTANIAALAHDAGTVHLYRSFVFSGAISDGVLYPRWVQFLHWGLGSPVFTFNPPLPYYALDGLFRVGIQHPLGWRLLVGAGLLAAAAGTFALVYQLTQRRAAALVAAVAFLYAPYVLRNAFERGSLEMFSMFLYPWVLWSLVWLARRPTAERLLVASLLWATCIASHVLAPLMLAPFAALLALILAWRRRTLMPLAALLAGGLLTAFIWLPIAPERNWVHLEYNFDNAIADPASHPVPWDELLAGPAVFDVQRDGNLPSRGVGWIHLAVLLLGIPAALYAWGKGRRGLATALAAFALAGLLLLWMLTGASDTLWQALQPVLTPLEFRIRLMGVLSLASAVTAGLLVALLPQRWQLPTAVAVSLVVIGLALPSLYVSLQHRYGLFEDALDWQVVRQAELKSGGSAFTSWNEFLPRWRTAPFDDAVRSVLADNFAGAAVDDAALSVPLDLPPGVTATVERVDSSRWDVALDVATPATVTLPILYYPRWQAELDGQPIALRPQPATGYVQLDAPAGPHRLALRYGVTPAEVAGLLISGVTLIALVAWSLASRRRNPMPAPVVAAAIESEAAPPWWLLVALAAVLLTKWVAIDPATTWLRCVSTSERVCGAQATVDVPFAGGHRLRGYAVPSYRVKAGGELRVNLFWQAEPGLTSPLHSFVHLRNSRKDQALEPTTGQEIWAQEDHVNPGGLLTTEFVPGKLYSDEVRVAIPETMPAGEYFLEVGWFDPASGEQLEPLPEAVRPPLRILWRSILLPSVTVE